MAYPPRAPLVVLPEASGFPGEFAAPWTANREEEDAPAAATGTSGDPRGRVSVSGSRSVPTRALPRPVVPCASETATASPSGAARDVDSEVGAHPDTLRSLSLMHGDLVTITERVGGETRVGTIVAATRWLRPASLSTVSPTRSSSRREMRRTAFLTTTTTAETSSGSTRVPVPAPGGCDATCGCTCASGGERGGDGRRGGSSGARRRRVERATNGIDRVRRDRDRRAHREDGASTLRLDHDRASANAKPAVPGTTPWFATPSEENALAALEAAAAEHFRRADRLLAVGDVFAATSVVPLDAVAAMASRAENEAGAPRMERNGSRCTLS